MLNNVNFNTNSNIQNISPSSTSKVNPKDALHSFSDMLSDALSDVNKEQVISDKMSQQLAAGQVKDLHQVMIQKEKAGVVLDLTIQIRNKVIEAYQEVMRMGV